MLTLSIKEEVFGAGNTSNIDLKLSKSSLTLAELIQEKAAAEVRKAEAALKGKLPETKTPWSSEKEIQLNRAAIHERKHKHDIDEEKAGLKALAAFQTNAFFVLIDGEPKGDLQEQLELTGRSRVQFLRLTPLVGG